MNGNIVRQETEMEFRNKLGKILFN